jgi:NADH-quinone oxidoreductase subunit H
MGQSLFYIFIFPGVLFLSILAMFGEYADRILYARFQNRQGPPWFQPFADFIKLTAKEDIIPEDADKKMFKLMPVFALTAVLCAYLYIPLWSPDALFGFKGDLIVVIYLLTIPTLTFFLGGWYSASLYSMIGAIRSLTQLFAYEVPLFMAVLAPAMLADTWSLKEMVLFYNAKPVYCLFNIIGFVVSIIILLGKLEKVPFDSPEAETEIVGGTFTEYGGRFLAFFRWAIDIEMIVGASLVAAVFLPFGMELNPVLGFIIYIVKIFFIIAVMSLVRAVAARLRIEQMLNFSWKYLAPAALIQLLINIIAKGFLGI